MLRSMFSAISGLRAHQTKMDVTGNNIANVNTVGFKSSQTVFEDTLSQVMRAGGAPAAERGGTNPAQVGLGVKVAGITTNWTQGATQTTGRATDFMIEGDGFFVLQSGNEQLYTRAGSFGFDAAGNLVTNGGAKLQGWTADANGLVNTNAPIEGLSIPYGQAIPPTATSAGALRGNLSTDAVPGARVQTQFEMYDALGNAHSITYLFTKDAANDWSLAISDAAGNAMGAVEDVRFDAGGVMTTPAAAGTPPRNTVQFTPDPTLFPSWAGPVTVDLTAITQFGGKSDIAAVTPEAGGGAAAGTLQAFSLGNDGTITGIFSNGQRKTLGQLALASFANPSGLEKAGSSTFRAANNSGVPLVGQPGGGGRGVLSAGALEMSNVDLAEEFTGLIVAQRGFQANSRVITSSDEILQDLVNLKR